MKQIIIGLGLAGMLGCAPLPPAVRARQDYSAYPQYKENIALYNIARILEENCNPSKWRVDEEGLFCEQEVTYNRFNYVVTEDNEIRVEWSDISKASVGNYPYTYTFFVRKDGKEKNEGFFSNSQSNRLKTRNENQADDIAQAVNIYLASRK